jgi:hypothetical protein
MVCTLPVQHTMPIHGGCCVRSPSEESVVVSVPFEPGLTVLDAGSVRPQACVPVEEQNSLLRHQASGEDDCDERRASECKAYQGCSFGRGALMKTLKERVRAEKAHQCLMYAYTASHTGL